MPNDIEIQTQTLSNTGTLNVPFVNTGDINASNRNSDDVIDVQCKH